jgi:hypothetical protein
VKRSAKWGGAFAFLGSVFPISYLVLYQVGMAHRFPDWGIYIWPTALGLIATDGREADRMYVLGVEAVSVILNALLWFIVGLAVSAIAERLGRARKARPEA